jgi:peptidoglycan/xylan/chitin deacetylase (PgdA/CDA1 family)
VPAPARIPDFVWRELREPPAFGVPLLLFHWVEPAEFAGHLAWLARAGYATLSADEVAAVARGERAAPPRAVALTFDDGVYNNWAVVAPLLRRHGMRGIAFVVPRLIREGPRRPTLEDAEAGRAPLGQVLDDAAAGRYLTWEETAALAAEGVLEIQSHTYDHAQVFTSDEVVDFQHPRPDGTPRYPWLWSAAGVSPDDPLWGAPVYPTAPRMEARRYHDDDALRDACMRFATVRGGRGFFADVTWREELGRFVALERKRFGPGRLERLEETRAERLATLARARAVLAERIGRPVDHIALPWSRAAPDSARLICEAGYRSGYIAETPGFRLRPGADPYRLARLEGYWLRSLPGPGRVSLLDRVSRRLARRWRPGAVAPTAS